MHTQDKITLGHFSVYKIRIMESNKFVYLYCFTSLIQVNHDRDQDPTQDHFSVSKRSGSWNQIKFTNLCCFKSLIQLDQDQDPMNLWSRFGSMQKILYL